VNSSNSKFNTNSPSSFRDKTNVRTDKHSLSVNRYFVYCWKIQKDTQRRSYLREPLGLLGHRQPVFIWRRVSHLR